MGSYKNATTILTRVYISSTCHVKCSSKIKSRSSSAPPKMKTTWAMNYSREEIANQSADNTRESEAINIQATIDSDDDLTSDIENDIALIRSTDLKNRLRDKSVDVADIGGSTDTTPTPESIKFTARKSGGTAWTGQKIQDLCTLWELEPFLYDASHPDLNNHHKRCKAIQRITAKLDVTGMMINFSMNCS